MRFILFVTAFTLISSFASAQPARFGRVHGTLNKTTSTLSPISVKTEKVCDIDGDVPVFEPPHLASFKNLPICTSTVNGVPVKIYLSAVIEIHKSTLSGNLAKSAVAIMNIEMPGEDGNFRMASAGTPDLTARSIFLTLNNTAVDASASKIQEAFDFDLSYDDNNQ